MHNSALQAMRDCVEAYVPTGVELTIVDVGSRTVAGQTAHHRSLIDEKYCTYIGVDINDGNNVDVVMEHPYRIPLDDSSADVVLSGQVFEHIPYVWVTMLEIARIMRPGGRFLLSAPSRGHVHNPPYDCWRFYPDAYRALAGFSTLELLEVRTDFPPLTDKKRFKYSGITEATYWGDTVGVFEKTPRYDERGVAQIRESLVTWANDHANISTPVAAPRNVSTLSRARDEIRRRVSRW